MAPPNDAGPVSPTSDYNRFNSLQTRSGGETILSPKASRAGGHRPIPAAVLRLEGDSTLCAVRGPARPTGGHSPRSIKGFNLSTWSRNDQDLQFSQISVFQIGISLFAKKCLLSNLSWTPCICHIIIIFKVLVCACELDVMSYDTVCIPSNGIVNFKMFPILLSCVPGRVVTCDTTDSNCSRSVSSSSNHIWKECAGLGLDYWRCVISYWWNLTTCGSRYRNLAPPFASVRNAAGTLPGPRRAANRMEVTWINCTTSYNPGSRAGTVC